MHALLSLMPLPQEHPQIHDAREKDLPHCEILSRTQELRTPEGEYPTIQYLRTFIGKGLFLVAESNSRIIGYLAAEILNGAIAYLNCLVVEPAFRQKGVGTLLISEIKKRFVCNNLKMVFFFAPLSNSESLIFYERNGFIGNI